MTITSYEQTPRFGEDRGDSALSARLRQLWATKPGLIGWLSTVDHKEIGIRYIFTAFGFLALGGLEALVLRIQLARPNQHVLTPEQYNELFTMHGVTMIFLYASPILSGFSNYLWPLLLGARDMALPRLNAFSYWSYLFSGLFIYASFVLGMAPNDGWFNYVPYASRKFNPGPNIDFLALGLIFLGISTTAGAANFLVTMLRMRAPGMSINRLPILIWGTLTASAGNLLAVPCVSLAFFLLWMDRQFGTHFYDVSAGGQPLLWQHLFWMFGHPWVYAIVLPAMGMVSDALPVFCRRPLVGYTAVALSTVLTMVIGFGVWVHHMFATGLPPMALSFFSAASQVIVVPSAVAVFAWIATIWGGRPVFTTAFLFCAGFIMLFVIGGVSGFMTGSVPVDWQLTDTYFVVGHLHYVLIGINVFPVVGAVYFWFPKMTGRLLDERLEPKAWNRREARAKSVIGGYTAQPSPGKGKTSMLMNVVIIIAGVSASVLFLFLVTRTSTMLSRKQSNDFTGAVVAVIGTTYAVILAFTLAGVWNMFQQAQNNEEAESELAGKRFPHRQPVTGPQRQGGPAGRVRAMPRTRWSGSGRRC